jgi:hypothetical protein
LSLATESQFVRPLCHENIFERHKLVQFNSNGGLAPAGLSVLCAGYMDRSRELTDFIIAKTGGSKYGKA